MGQAIVTCLNKYHIKHEDVNGFVSDNAAYCKKAVKEILIPLFPNAVHICCLAHIINLVGDNWKFAQGLRLLQEFTNMYKSAFKKKGARKRRFQQHMLACGMNSTLAPSPVSTRWRSWFSCVTYHSTRLDHYLDFFEREQRTSQSVAIDRLVKILDEELLDLKVMALFVAHSCPKVEATLVHFESTQPQAHTVINWLEGLEIYLSKGTAQVTFSPELDAALVSLRPGKRATFLDTFHDIYMAALTKFSKHVDQLPAKALYEEIRMFDPQQVGAMSKELADYSHIGLPQNGRDLEAFEVEWLMYLQEVTNGVTGESSPVEYWEARKVRMPRMSAKALVYLKLTQSSCDAERSFSLYKHINTDKRERATEEHVRMMSMLHYNGDVTKSLMVHRKFTY